MLDALSALALEVKYLDEATAFYRRHLDLPVRRETDHEVALEAGDTDLVLRRPDRIPRGGLHTHYAFSCSATAYETWWDRLDGDFDLEEHTFGPVRSLYFYDTEGNCVEVMGSDEGDDEGITGLVEVVLEVADLDRARAFYEALGMETVDVGENRKRVRLTAGPFDFELWEPHLGLADARGGVHVDVTFETVDPDAALDAVRESVRDVTRTDDGIRVTDPDGHSLLFT
ncbi:VOC family protein [Halorarius litoreus]|uniref:VOC family protein n=1 Tax=Halorarius litoreus TaxID=2962676 RepID=UPI0020CF836C|nr:VOC family protein [Halorarius litoreus]